MLVTLTKINRDSGERYPVAINPAHVVTVQAADGIVLGDATRILFCGLDAIYVAEDFETVKIRLNGELD